MSSQEVPCYNRGCGKSFKVDENDKNDCCHHPGLPYFHDAYKGWSCCKKQCIDFTEFLNIKGCTLGPHSKEKLLDTPKPAAVKEVVPVQKKYEPLPRPPVDSKLTVLVPKVASSLQATADNCPHSRLKHEDPQELPIVVGTSCKNGGCKGSYAGADSETEQCVHHPGVPIFHEGMKYWSCCQKKTTDFNTFLNQVGCRTGLHKFKKEASVKNAVTCRWDWHQTATHVVVAIYAKQYSPTESSVRLSPVRLCVQLCFPREGGAMFDMDVELRGIVDVAESSAHMMGTKVEISLRKAEPGSWSMLDIPKPKAQQEQQEQVKEQHVWQGDDDDDIDLDEIEPIPQMKTVNITEVHES